MPMPSISKGQADDRPGVSLRFRRHAWLRQQVAHKPLWVKRCEEMVRTPNRVSSSDSLFGRFGQLFQGSMPSGYSVNDLLEVLRLVRANDPNMQRVVVEGCPLPPAYIQALLQAVADNSYVTHLRLIRVGIDESQAKNLAACLLKAPALVLVDWSKNKIGDACCLEIADALQKRSEQDCILRKLSLENNCISDNGLSNLLGAIRHVSTLTTLKLGRQPYSEAGVEQLCHFLTDSQSSVSRLDLRGIALTTKGAVLLSEALAQNTTIERLVLARNNVNSEGAIALAESLRKNSRLTTLDLQRNQVDDSAADIFAHVLESNHVFGKLKLRNTSVTDDAKQKLLDLLVMNAHGPKLAKETKRAYAELLASQVYRFQNSKKCSMPDLVELDGTERSEDDEHHGQYDDSPVCVICFGQFHDEHPCVILPCRHSNACGACCARLQSCHMCRSPVVKVFGISAPSTKRKGAKTGSKDLQVS